MAVSNVSVFRPFLTEAQWAKETIGQINEYKSRNWAIGLNGDTGKPDGFTTSFAERDMNFVTYIRGAGLQIGTPDAYAQNIALVNAYIDRERQEEIAMVHNTMAQLADYKSRNWAIGLSWPDDVYSLSHIALPFAPDDPLYGDDPRSENPGIRLGRLALHGENGTLSIPPTMMTRQRWNPFHAFMATRIAGFVREHMAGATGP